MKSATKLEILIKIEFKVTEGTTSDGEVQSQIHETDNSSQAVETFEAETQSFSIFRLNWIAGTHSVFVCRGKTQKIVLTFVAAVFDPHVLSSPCTTRMRLLLKNS